MALDTMPQCLFTSASDRWATPVAVQAALSQECALNVDPCPLDGEVNGLAPLFCRWHGKRVWWNPPYGPGIAAWVERGCEAECAVFLLPARTDTRWFHQLCLPYAREIRFLRGRLTFVEAVNSAPFRSMVVIFTAETP